MKITSYNLPLVISSLVLAVMLLSCVDDVDRFVVQEVMLRGDIVEMMSVLEEPPVETTIDAGTLNVIMLEKAILTIPAKAFEQKDGDLIEEGELVVRVREIYEKSQMIKHAVPTVTDDRSLLESDGVFHIEIFQDGKKVQLAEGQSINLKIENDAPRSGMELFLGERLDRADFVWIEADGDPGSQANVWTSEWTIGVDSNQQRVGIGYETELVELDWINCDIFNGETPTTDVCVDLPPGYDVTNTIVYMMFEELNAVAALWGNEDKEMFCTGPTVPLNKEVTLLVLSQLGDDHYATSVPAVIEQDLVLTAEPQKMSLEEVKELIENL